MVPLIKNIKQYASKIEDEVIENRRYLHKHPELSFQESNTSAFIKQKLEEMKVEWISVANTGIVAFIKGKLSDETVVLRADIDALPIKEENDIDYSSENNEVMHACGHDVHTASLLGTIKILNSIKHEIKGNIMCIFQPAEEKLPGGAKQIIDSGIFNDKKIKAVIAQHVMPSIETGKIALREGKFMASMDEITICVNGKGGHGAEPHNTIDPVVIASNIVITLQQLVSRNSNPNIPTVLSFGKFHANGSFNVIPKKVILQGTLRTFNETWRNKAHEKIKAIASSIAESMGANCDIHINKGYPFLINDKKISNNVCNHIKKYVGNKNFLEPDLWMASEDFAYYSQKYPSAFYLLGVGNKKKNITSALHTSTFNIDEDVLEISTGLMAYTALKLLHD
ncbi:M20 family metallopeptidase [Maribellus sp. YY47]|uniref:M20 metallopeptidase family protein n=1 Tax=Maribellus sp. YY47 TaxID=2929486 RepID=UPI0020007DA0|nr:M20 family metallopeptidase [Maribellus sp. YY47]MCK3684363.1 M20 family metallopeptidase [Maribellus sp. YY47]